MTKTAPNGVDHDVNFMIGAGKYAGAGERGALGRAVGPAAGREPGPTVLVANRAGQGAGSARPEGLTRR